MCASGFGMDSDTWIVNLKFGNGHDKIHKYLIIIPTFWANKLS